MENLQGETGASERARAGDALITSPPFEAVWPDVERRLRALLYRRGLDKASAEDVVQEVALRALAGRVTYTSAKDLLRWAAPVACNLHVDLLRQRAWVEHAEVDPDRPDWNDVAGEVAERLELQRALRGIAKLRPDDREAILSAVTEEQVAPRSRKEAVRLAVRRHRARSRLALVMEQIAAWVFGWRWLRSSRTATAAALLVPVAAVPLLGGTPLPRETAVPPATTIAGAPPEPARAPLRQVVAAPPAPRPAQPARAAAAAAAGHTHSHRRVTAPTRPRPAPAVAVEGDGGPHVRVGGDSRRPGDRTVCVRLPIGERVCLD